MDRLWKDYQSISQFGYFEQGQTRHFMGRGIIRSILHAYVEDARRRISKAFTAQRHIEVEGFREWPVEPFKRT